MLGVHTGFVSSLATTTTNNTKVAGETAESEVVDIHAMRTMIAVSMFGIGVFTIFISALICNTGNVMDLEKNNSTDDNTDSITKCDSGVAAFLYTLSFCFILAAGVYARHRNSSDTMLNAIIKDCRKVHSLFKVEAGNDQATGTELHAFSKDCPILRTDVYPPYRDL